MRIVDHASWQLLGRHAAELRAQSLSDLVGTDSSRFEQLSFTAAGLRVDLSKQPLTTTTLSLFSNLAGEAGLAGARDSLFSGGLLNASEQRAVLHTALRAQAAEQPATVRDDIGAATAKMQALVQAVRGGAWRGHGGRTISHVVHIGIGGSALGPALALDALAESADGPHVTVLANIDGHELQRVLGDLRAERTLFIVASKSFRTTETLVNAESARAWLLERGIPRAALRHHFIAVSANVAAAVAFGIDADNVLPMWDWVGGRYSLWSAIGLPVALAVGWSAFTDLLAGAREMDVHFRNAPWSRNLPFLGACSELWNLHFLGATSTAVIAYDHRLKLLPAYLQQLYMESNGKSVGNDGAATGIHTAPVVWGGEGTNGQHAYHQLLHQGTRAVAVEFVLVARPHHQRADHHRWLLANGLAQSEALLVGRSHVDPQRAMPGNRPSTSVLLEELTPATLGALLAFHEHRAFVQGALWGINSFDQWGVELGKTLAEQLHDELAAGGGRERPRHDASTAGLLHSITNALEPRAAQTG